MEFNSEQRERLRIAATEDPRGFFSWLFGADKPPEATPPAPQVATLAAALCVGLNRVDPAGYGGWSGELKGCRNDATLAASVAASRMIGGRNPLVRLDADGISGDFAESMMYMAERAYSGDNVFIWVSSHGGQYPDRDGDEDDGQDETLCLYDRQFGDDEMWKLFSRFRPGVNIYMGTDACHSGTNARAYERTIRTLPATLQQAAYQAQRSRYEAIRTTTNRGEIRANLVTMSACADNQVAYDGPQNGAFTEAFFGQRGPDGFRGTARDVMRRVVRSMSANQTPQLNAYGPEGHLLLDRPFPF